MCGLVAVVAKWQTGFSKQTIDAFADLLFIDALRGEDSTGMFVVEKDGDVSLAKEATHSVVFQRSKEYKDLMSTAYRNGRYLVGHNRKATKGSITDENAHPFAVDDKIVLVHNGTLWGDHKEMANTEVDSHAIAHVLADNPDDVQKAFDKINGAYALIWYDVLKEKLHLLRNSQRPLFWVETQDAWIYSSEVSMLAFAITRNNLTLKGKIEGQPDHLLTTFHWKNGSMDVNSLHIIPYVYPAYVAPTNGYSKIDEYTPELKRIETNDSLWKFGDENFQEEASRLEILRQVPTRTESVGKAVAEEEKIARENSCILSRRRFPQVEAAYTKGLRLTMTCVDTVYVNGKNDDSGSFIYGTLNDDPYILVKTHLPKGTDENKILDWTLNNRIVTITVNNIIYRPYSAAYNNTLTGFALIFGKDLSSPGYTLANANDDTFASSTIQLGNN